MITRRGAGLRPAAPVRLIHLGLGNFFRAHQAWYTDRAPDSSDWGYAVFTGRSAGIAGPLSDQEGVYTLVTRSAGADRFDPVASISVVHTAADHEAWLNYFRDPAVAAVTVTVTEAGYLRRPGGAGMDMTREDARADAAALLRHPAPAVSTVPARLLAGLMARQEAGAGPLAVIPCDNLPDNGPAVAEVMTDLARAVNPGLESWMTENLTVVSTVVDRITPRTAPETSRLVRAATGWSDACPVVTEPYSEWILDARLPPRRPAWEGCGAVIADDVAPYERRKLWLLNGAHSLLAYAGSLLGFDTVPDAAADARGQAWLDEWWSVASPHVGADTGPYLDSLRERFGNVRMADRLVRIAEDGSQKIPVRILPVLRAERAAGRVPPGATRVIAGWICHLRGMGAPVRDARASELLPLARRPWPDSVAAVLGWLGSDLADDLDLRRAVQDQGHELSRQG